MTTIPSTKKLKNNYLRDQALKIFFRHFFSTQWLRELCAERRSLYIDYGRDNEYSLCFLTRLAIDFYPTCAILEKMMQIVERPISFKELDKFYFFGAILEMSKKYETDPKMVELCSQVMKVPFEKQSSSKEFVSLVKELSSHEPQSLIELTPSSLLEHIQRIIDQKIEFEETLRHEDLFHYFKQLAEPFLQYYQEFENASPSDLSFHYSDNFLLPFAMKCIQDNHCADLITGNNNRLGVLSLFRYLVDRKLSRMGISMFRRIVSNISKYQPDLIEPHSVALTTFISTVNGLCHDSIDQFMDRIIKELGPLQTLSSVMNGFNREFRMIYESIVFVTPENSPAWFQEEFKKRKNEYIEKTLSAFCPKLQNYASAPLSVMFIRNRNLQNSLQSLSATMVAFQRRSSSTPERFQEYLVAWKEYYLKEFLSYFQTISDQIESSRPNSVTMTDHLGRINDFTIVSTLDEFQEITDRMMIENENADNENTMKRLRECIMFVVEYILKQSHLQARTTILQTLSKFKKVLLSLLDMEEEVRYVIKVREEIKLLYPEVDEQLLNEIQWDKRSVFQRIILQIAENFHSVSEYDSPRIITVINALFEMIEDVDQLFVTNKAISHFIHFNTLLPIGFVQFFLNKQIDLFTTVSKTLNDSSEKLFSNESLYSPAHDVSRQILVYFQCHDPQQDRERRKKGWRL